MSNLTASVDSTVLKELGKRISRLRIEAQLTQEDTAHESGISKRTLERFEHGESIQLSSFIRILRVLDKLKTLDALLPKDTISPMELIKQQHTVKKRVYHKKTGTSSQSSAAWVWGEDR